MIGTVVSAALWALAASLVLSVLVGSLVAGLIAVARPAAATRQALWFVALAAAGCAPVAILAIMLVHGALEVMDTPVPVAAGRHQAVWTTTPSANGAWYALHPGVKAPAGIVLRVPRPPKVTPLAAEAIVGVWAFGALLGLAGLARSIGRVRGLKRRSSALDGTLATELPWLTTTSGREIYLRLSYETETPIAVGFRRPVILLPTEMATADGLTAIEPLIMHEYAHLAGYDDWLNLAQRATERIFWFNPLVWVLGARISLEREVAADEAVVARTHDAKRYASTLWRMAQEMRMPEHVVVAPSAMLTRKQISVRIERLLDDHPASQRYIRAAAFAIAIVAATGVAAVAAGAPPIVFENPEDMPKVEVQAPPLPAPDPPQVMPSVRALPTKPPAPPEPPALPARPALSAAEQRAIAAERRAEAIARHAAAAARQFDADRLAQRIQADVEKSLAGVAGRHSDEAGACVGCDYAHRDLHGYDFSNKTLFGADFDHADLRGANFSGATLQGTSMQHADLTGANLHGAKLTGVDLTRAILDHADLSAATLTGVDLTKASMTGTDTTGIRLIGSSLP